MAIITMLVGLGVLLAFTVLGCVLEVFLARRESIWPGLVLPILAGLYAVVMVLSYTVAPDTPWNQVLGAVLLRRSFIFRMQKVRDAAQKQKAADDAGLHAEGAAF